jgi:phosphoglycerate dehydrogenase-like enzyme
MAMPRVFIGPEVFFQVPGPHVELLRSAGFDVAYPPRKVGLQGEEETISHLRNVVAVIAGGEYFTPRVFENLPKLRVVARAGVGYDRVNVPAASRHGVVVTVTPTANHEAVAEHTFALVLDLAKWVTRQDKLVRAGTWSDVPLAPLRGKTLGLVGLGRIGKSVALRARAFRMNVIAHDTAADEAFARENDIEIVDFPTILARSDYVSLHVPLCDQTRHIMNIETFSKMKPGSFLVNTSRGGLVDETALVAALEAGWLAGAGLDVFAHEPIPARHALLKYDTVVLTPHRAGGDVQSNQDMALEAAQTIIDLAQGRWPDAAVVNPDIRPGWKW